MRKFIILAALAVSTLSAVAGPFEDGASAYKRGDYSTAINRWRPLAASDPTIQNNYGIMYKDGKGVKRDLGMAATWFSRSASAGSSLGQNNLGGLYRDGKGVNRDFGKAVTYFSASAAQGNAAGQLNLGLLYMYGQGVRQDLTKAYMWFDLASAQSLKQAAYNRQLVATKMNQQAQLQAHNLAQRCADQNFRGCGA